MREILAQLDRWQARGEAIALATLVLVHRSAPRLAGARMAVTRSGKMVGSVSGGCVENEVFERAMRVLDSREPVVANYGIADELGFQAGLSCGGSIDVLIEPFDPTEAWQTLRRAVTAHEPAAWCVGLTPPSILGCKLAVTGDTVAGGIRTDVDGRVTEAARRLMLQGGAQVVVLPGETGETTVFVEPFPPPPRLFIVGATHTAIPLCRFAKALGFRITVVDARSTYASNERFPDADEVLREWPQEVFDRIPLDAYSYVVTLTHDAKFDHPALTCALRSQARYIGAIGSRGTRGKRAARLRDEEGFTDSDLARIHSPIGLDIGGRTPEEIALAIVAEMLAVRNERDGRSLRERTKPIHGRS